MHVLCRCRCCRCRLLLLSSLSLLSQFEAWLSCQKATSIGLVSASEHERRCTIRCIHNAPASQHQQLLGMWGGMTANGAYGVLSKPDVVVTNQSDKDTQLPKLLMLDRLVADCMTEMESNVLDSRLSA